MQFGRALGTVASEHRLGWACGRQGPGRDVTDPDMVGPGCCLSSCGRQRRQKEDQTGSKRGLYGGMTPMACPFKPAGIRLGRAGLPWGVGRDVIWQTWMGPASVGPAAADKGVMN